MPLLHQPPLAMITAVNGAAGHRSVPHTADMIVEAWAPTRARCIEQAVLGLVEELARPRGRAEPTPRTFEVRADADAAVLLSVLQEVIYLADTEAIVPMDVRVEQVDQQGARGTFWVLPLADVAQVGSVPKAVSWRDLKMERSGPEWRCRAIIDV